MPSLNHCTIIMLTTKTICVGCYVGIRLSIGLALTMVMSGVIAALSVKHVSKRWSGFGSWSRKAPYFSSGVMILIGCYVAFEGLKHILA